MCSAHLFRFILLISLEEDSMVTKSDKKVIMLSVSSDTVAKLEAAGIRVKYHLPDKYLWCMLTNVDIVQSTSMVPPFESIMTVDQLLQLRMLPCYDSRYILYKEFFNEQR